MFAKSNSTLKHNTIYEHRINSKGDNIIFEYHKGRYLGKGGFATVYEINKANDEKIMAIKIVKKPTDGTKS